MTTGKADRGIGRLELEVLVQERIAEQVLVFQKEISILQTKNIHL